MRREKPEPIKRHLHESGLPTTLCGLHRGIEGVRTSVHVTKARKSDCEKCRVAYRQQLRKRRAKWQKTPTLPTKQLTREQLRSDRREWKPLPKVEDAITPEVAAHLNEQCGNPECGTCHICQWDHKTSEHKNPSVWVLVQEVESGADTYELLSAHKSKAGADEAEKAWLEDHEGMAAHSHAFDEHGGEAVSSDWCQECGCCVRIVELGLED